MNILEIKPEHISEYIHDGGFTSFVSSKIEVYPFSYLEYAKTDIAIEISRRTIVNSLSNAKRAFHFQVDIICDCLGWGKQKALKNSGFPAKLEYLSKCGVISPNILLKLNRVRNSVEHEYTAPGEEELRDYIDIVELFLMATKTLMDQFPKAISFRLMQDEDYDPTLELPEVINTEITLYDGGIVLKADNETRVIEINDPDYYLWLASIVRSYLL
jgi:hypothetical protein